MSPKCLDCGQREVFDHYIEGVEIRRYDVDTGDVEEVRDEFTETSFVQCSQCDSTEVDW